MGIDLSLYNILYNLYMVCLLVVLKHTRIHPYDYSSYILAYLEPSESLFS